MSHNIATCVPKDFHTRHITLDLWVKGRRAARGEHVLALQLLLGARSDRWTVGGSVTLQLTARAVAHGHGPTLLVLTLATVPKNFQELKTQKLEHRKFWDVGQICFNIQS